MGSFSFPVEGIDHFSQRIEIFALATALRLFNGNLNIYCAAVIKYYEFLQNNNFELTILKGWDPLDTWESVYKAETRRLGTTIILKMTAHGRWKNQNPDRTEGNRKADELAKAYINQLFKNQLNNLTSKIIWDLDFQSHLIYQFYQNTSSAILQEYGLDAEFTESSDIKISPAQNYIYIYICP